MKQYSIIKRAQNNVLNVEIDSTIYTNNTLNVALELCKANNKFIDSKQYKWEIVELTPLLQIKPEHDMYDDELKKRRVYYENLIILIGMEKNNG